MGVVIFWNSWVRAFYRVLSKMFRVGLLIKRRKRIRRIDDIFCISENKFKKIGIFEYCISFYIFNYVYN